MNAVPIPAIRIVINRDMFRTLVAGQQISISKGPDTIVLNLDLDSPGGLAKYSDPPEAREFLKKPRIGQPR